MMFPHRVKFQNWKYIFNTLVVVVGCCALCGTVTFAQAQASPEVSGDGYVKVLSNVLDDETNKNRLTEARRLAIIEEHIGLNNRAFHYSLSKGQKLVVHVLVERDGKTHISERYAITAEAGSSRNDGIIIVTLSNSSEAVGMSYFHINLDDKYRMGIPLDLQWSGSSSEDKTQGQPNLDEESKEYELWTYETHEASSSKPKFRFQISCAREPMTKEDEPGKILKLKK